MGRDDGSGHTGKVSGMRRLKILVSAYACEPDKGSEPGVGWNWAKQIARFYEVWVITRANNRDSIEGELKRNPDENLHFIYYDVPTWLSFWKKGPRGMHLYYFLWQLGIWRIARKLSEEENFYVVHHITFGSVFLPTFLPLLSTPFVWGPIGGAEQVTRKFRKDWSARPRLKEGYRDVLVRILRFNPLFLLACRKANLILSKTEDTARRIPDRYADKVVVMTDVGVSLHSFISVHNRRTNHQQVLAVGSLDAWRGFDLAIRAFRLVADKFKEMKLVIVGAGRERIRLARLSQRLGVDDRVLLEGKVEQRKYKEYLINSDILLNPCLKEGGVTVLLEALSCEMPVVCLDIPGSSRIITEACGVRVKLSTPEVTVQGLGKALERLISDPSLRERMGQAGRALARLDHSWDKKGEFIRDAYAHIIPNGA